MLASLARSAPIREPNPSRVMCVLLGAFSIHGFIMLAARDSGTLFAVSGAVVSALLIGSIGEWLVHRYVMHGPWRFRPLKLVYDLHHRGHHFVHYTPDHYVHSGPVNYVPVYPPRPQELCTDGRSRLLSVLAQLGFYLAIAIPFVQLPAWLVTRNPVFTAVFAGMVLFECVLFVRVHDLVHHPDVGWIRRLPGFRWLDHHHYIHHIDTRANTNFLLPWGDIFFGTWRATITPEEQARWPVFETARSSRYDPSGPEERLVPDQ